jgi:hypothetical protein
MTPSEWHALLLFGKRTAKVATVRPDGPHMLRRYGSYWTVTTWDRGASRLVFSRRGRAVFV